MGTPASPLHMVVRIPVVEGGGGGVGREHRGRREASCGLRRGCRLLNPNGWVRKVVRASHERVVVGLAVDGGKCLLLRLEVVVEEFLVVELLWQVLRQLVKREGLG